MTCKEVVALIETLPRTEWRAGQGEFVRDHVHTCASCRSALAASDALDLELAGLADATLPVDLSARTMARIARVDEDDYVPVGRTARDRPPNRRRELLGSAVAVGGLIAGVGAHVYSLIASGWTFDPTASRIGGPGALVAAPDAGATGILLGLGLLVYLTGLLGPHRNQFNEERR